MSNKISTVAYPKWIGEVTKSPQKYIKEFFKTLAFAKLKEYERQIQPFKAKYKISFDLFEERVKTQKKENFEIWDDYLIWKGLNLSYQKWLKRYKKI